MFDIFRKRRIKKYAKDAWAYVLRTYEAPAGPREIRYSLKEKEPESTQASGSPQQSDEVIRYSLEIVEQPIEQDTHSSNIKVSLQEKPKPEDSYSAFEVTRLLRSYSTTGDFNKMLQTLEESVNQSFVDRLLHYINEKGVRDSEVYKAAQVDKRLFSKMVSNREYKPSKDTAIALALALELSLEEASDLLSRAGYTFSHSNKRDIVIEFFFRERVYNLMDVNDVLYRLNQKLIGRT